MTGSGLPGKRRLSHTECKSILKSKYSLQAKEERAYWRHLYLNVIIKLFGFNANEEKDTAGPESARETLKLLKFLPSRHVPVGERGAQDAHTPGKVGGGARELFLLSEDPQVDPALGSAGLEASEALWKPRAGPFFNWCYSLAVLLSWLAEPQHGAGCLCGGRDVGLWARQGEPHTQHLSHCSGRASQGPPAPEELTPPLPRSCPGVTQLAASPHFL